MPKTTNKTAPKKAAKKKTAKKAAPEAGKKSAGKKGTRYSVAAKRKIIAFVEQVNSDKGRGGVAAAARKFGVSPLSIGNWLRKAGDSKPAKASKPGSSRRAPSMASGRDQVLGELVSLNREIASKRGELEALEARFESLKASL